MATKKKTSKKKTVKAKTARKKPTEAAKRSTKPASTKSAKKKPAAKKTSKKKAAKKIPARKKPSRSPSISLQDLELPRAAASRSRADSDFQGLSRSESADSESVDELVEEGNTFEAGAVRGVEEADDADEKEVHTHEFAEDDVPGEYLDED